MKRFFIVIAIAFMIIIVIVKKKNDFVFKREEISICVSGEVKQETCHDLPLGSKLCDLTELLELSDKADRDFFKQNITLRNDDRIIVPAKSEIEKISLNRADHKQLCKLPGIGPVLAQRIIDYRQEYGLFQRLEDIQKVKGIKAKIFEKIKDFICL